MKTGFAEKIMRFVIGLIMAGMMLTRSCLLLKANNSRISGHISNICVKSTGPNFSISFSTIHQVSCACKKKMWVNVFTVKFTLIQCECHHQCHMYCAQPTSRLRLLPNGTRPLRKFSIGSLSKLLAIRTLPRPMVLSRFLSNFRRYHLSVNPCKKSSWIKTLHDPSTTSCEGSCPSSKFELCSISTCSKHGFSSTVRTRI